MFERVAAAFDADVARRRICESSGSEHSPESSADLSDLVNSFMEKSYEGACYEGEDDESVNHEKEHEEGGEEELEKREMLEGIFNGVDEYDDEHERDAREEIRGEVELACGFVGDSSLPEFKRRLMSWLREKGFDAGLCKSKWEKNGRVTAGHYEYIDVNFSGTRYIVEVSLVAEFEIARPTSQYSCILKVFPHIFVGKVEELKRVVRLVCNAIKCSMKRRDMHVPPWRRNGYMKAKWFGSYKRTTNAISTRKASSPLSPEFLIPQRSIGFEPWPVKAHNCGGDYEAKTGFRIGHLTAAFNSDGFGMQ